MKDNISYSITIMKKTCIKTTAFVSAILKTLPTIRNKTERDNWLGKMGRVNVIWGLCGRQR